MNEEKRPIEVYEPGFRGWWRRNKKTVYTVGGILVAAGCGYAIYRNRSTIIGLLTSTSSEYIVISNQQVSVAVPELVEEVIMENIETIPKIINGGEAFDVNAHIRNLANGRKASLEKLAEAAELGISLLDNQTLVDSYIKNAV